MLPVSNSCNNCFHAIFADLCGIENYWEGWLASLAAYYTVPWQLPWLRY